MLLSLLFDKMLESISCVDDSGSSLEDCRQSAAAALRSDFASSILLKPIILEIFGIARDERMLSPASTTMNSSNVKPLEFLCRYSFTMRQRYSYTQCLGLR